VPSFRDPALRPERPDLSGVRAIRFLTADDYPPLNFALDDGTLAGFNVEIARAICETLEIGCTIQARPFDTLIDSLTTGKGDAVIAHRLDLGDARDPRSSRLLAALLPDPGALRRTQGLCAAGRRTGCA